MDVHGDGKHDASGGDRAGIPLDEYLVARPDDSPRTPREIRHRLELFLRIGDAVHALHAQGSSRLNLDPENVLVVPGELWTVPEVRLRNPGGEKRAGDPRAEVFALGSILYRILIGPEAAGDRRRNLHLEASGLHDDLITILSGALASNPEDRYPDARALAGDVRSFLAYRPLSAPGARNRAVFGLAAAIAGVLILVSAKKVEDRLHGSRGDAGAKSGATRELIARSVHEVESAFPERSEVRARTLLALGHAYQSLGLSDDAGALFAKARETHEGAFEDARMESVTAAMVALGEHPGPGDVTRRSVTGIKDAMTSERVETATGLVSLASAYRKAGDAVHALPLYERALAIYAKTLGPDNPRAQECVREIVRTATEIGDAAGAREADERVRRIERGR